MHISINSSDFTNHNDRREVEGRHLTAVRYGCQELVLGQSTWDLWWTEQH